MSDAFQPPVMIFCPLASVDPNGDDELTAPFWLAVPITGEFGGPVTMSWKLSPAAKGAPGDVAFESTAVVWVTAGGVVVAAAVVAGVPAVAPEVVAGVEAETVTPGINPQIEPP
jgi:hypothetical protein